MQSRTIISLVCLVILLIPAITLALVTQTITTSEGTTVIVTNDDGTTTVQQQGSGTIAGQNQGYPGPYTPGSAGYLIEKRVNLNPGQFAQHQVQFDPPGLIELFVPAGCSFTLYAKSGGDWPTADNYYRVYNKATTATAAVPGQMVVSPGLWYLTIVSNAGSGQYYLVARDARLQNEPIPMGEEPAVMQPQAPSPDPVDAGAEPLNPAGEGNAGNGQGQQGEGQVGQHPIGPLPDPIDIGEILVNPAGQDNQGNGQGQQGEGQVGQHPIGPLPDPIDIGAIPLNPAGQDNQGNGQGQQGDGQAGQQPIGPLPDPIDVGAIPLNPPGQENAGNGQGQAGEQPVAPADPAPQASASCLEDQVFALTNEAYAAGDYVRDPALDAIARAHSTALCGRDQNQGGAAFSHILDGKGPDGRMNDAGYAWKSFAENIYHNGCAGGTCEDVASRALSGWLSSPGHRRNIMNENEAKNSHLGIGVASCGDGCYYITQLFATPR